MWAGFPTRGIRLRGHDLFLIPFSLMWGGFAVFWETMALKTGAPGFFAIWGIPFIVMAAYITIGRFFVDAWQRSRTTYALTDQRVVIVSGLLNRQVKSLALQTLGDISIIERGNGTGTIAFGTTPPMYGWLASASWPGASKYVPPSFDMIADVRAVYEAIRAAQRDTRQLG